MAQQKSEDCVVPEGGVMPAERAGSSPGGQGKAVPVEETAVQLCLPVATAENPQGATRRRTRDRLGALRAGAPKAIGEVETAAPATMEEGRQATDECVVEGGVEQGRPGPDGRRSRRCASSGRSCCPSCKPTCWRDVSAGRDSPGVHSQGGGWERGLGIPDVVDRVVHEAVRQVLEPLWEPTFHPSSHGFRPGRSCHTAIAEAKSISRTAMSGA